MTEAPTKQPSPRCPRCGSLVSAVTWTCVLGQFCPGERSSTSETWHHAGYVAEMAVWDIANRVKDRHDETVDAMRVHNGMTLEEFLAKQ